MNGLQPLPPGLADQANHGDGFIRTYKAWKGSNDGEMQEDATIVLPRGMSNLAIEINNGQFC
ncbi:ABC transporter C family member 5-like protein [Corchorus olitorius]|uniref:ABC transporter C family member 5-like protein n=1 Tax=Corchorus olitorius TaxID=93759 RepID=A0A1R3KFF8_9ROSI|nr:ABC transporter C family member 5-like protein [Corchorus olitorius]